MFSTLPRYLISQGSLRSSSVNRRVSVLFKLSNQDNNVTGTRQYHDVMGDILSPSHVMGISHIRDPRLNKGLGFTLEERQTLGIHGLLPARFKTQEDQLELCLLSISRYNDDLNKYIYLTELQDRNEKLFYRLLSENVQEMMPIVYTPTVGLACQKFGLIYRRPRGLFVNIHDTGNVFNVIRNWPEYDVRVICVTDGERILGLGDLGANGMGIPVGKLSLYTALAGVKPHQCLPITLDVGTNNKDLLEDPLYVGVRHERITGQQYDMFLEEFMQAIVRRYGQNCLIQFEDFANHNALRLLEKFRNRYCTFNDDIQGTASVVLAGLFAAARISKIPLKDQKYLFFGAGGASLGIANLITSEMISHGMSLKEAQSKIYLIDVNGLLTTQRKDLKPELLPFAKNMRDMKDLREMVAEIKPTTLIGASTVGGAFTPDILKEMAVHNQRPIIFALSNPTEKAECTAEAAYTNTEGRCVYSSGSPFGPVTYNGKTFVPGQGNNAYIFPGVGLGVICSGMHHIEDEVFLIAAKQVASMLSAEGLEVGSCFPPLHLIRECSIQIATAILKYAYKKGIATVYPEPANHRHFIETHLYNYYYENSMPKTWAWPEIPHIQTRPMEPKKKHGKPGTSPRIPV